MGGPLDPTPILASAPRVRLEGATVLLMRRPESPALLHGVIPPGMLDGVDACYSRGEGVDVSSQCAWSLEGGRPVMAVRITAPVALDLVVEADLGPDEVAGLARRPTVMTMIYPGDEERLAGLSDFRTGGVRGTWDSLGIVLALTPSGPLAAGAT